MKTWQFWVLLLVVIFIVIPVIVYGISLNAVTKVASSNPQLASEIAQGNNGGVVMRFIK